MPLLNLPKRGFGGAGRRPVRTRRSGSGKFHERINLDNSDIKCFARYGLEDSRIAIAFANDIVSSVEISNDQRIFIRRQIREDEEAILVGCC